MSLVFRGLLVLCAWLLVFPAATGGEEPGRRSDRFSGEVREPPSREVDFLHMRLECSFDWEAEAVQAKVTHRAKAFRDGVRSITLDAVSLDVDSVAGSGGDPLDFHVRPGKLTVELDRELRRGEEVTFTVSYRCRPRRGVYFFKPDARDPNSPRQVWTQGECDEARHWIPCFDHPIERITSEIAIAAPVPMIAISNGRLVDTEERGNERVFLWRQDKPHPMYLVSVVVGQFETWSDRWGDVALTGYVRPEYHEWAARSFEQTKDMMEFFSERTGYPYPWDRYDQVCVYGFSFGGMENTSATTLNERTLHDERAALDHSSHGLVAHELAHQWFGDLVTCRDWGDIWLNEGFATFWQNYYREAHDGLDEALYERREQAETYMREDRKKYRRTVAARRYRSPDDLFDRHSYRKGARILTMLRYVLGEDPFLAGMRLYVKRHAFQAVETADFRKALEDASGQSLRWFFDQWVHSGGHPKYRVRSEWDAGAGVLCLVVEQTQEVDDLTPLFQMPVVVELWSDGGKSRHRVWIRERKDTIHLRVAGRPKLVRFDPGDWVLKELDFEKTEEELLLQLREDADMMGRLRAAVDLGKRGHSRAVVEQLAARLTEEPFWGVRLEIARSLGKVESDIARVALAEAFGAERKSAVRCGILTALREHLHESVEDLARRAIAEDPSYEVVAAALRTLSRVDPEGSRSDLLAALDRDSHGESIRATAIDLLSRQSELGETEQSELVERVMKLAAVDNPAAVRTVAFRGLASLGRGNDRVREVLVAALEDRRSKVRSAAVEALGQLGDPGAIEALEKLRDRGGGGILQDTAQMVDDAIARIRGSEDVAELRRQVEDLRREVEELESRRDG